jgi:undecaprenyl-diphosphatase
MTGIFEWLNEADTNLFLLLNGMHSSFFDTVFYWASNKWIWIPFYAWLLFRWLKIDKKNVLRFLVFAALLVTTSDQLSGLIKKSAERPRPCHEAAIADKVHLVNNHCGGKFGFVSSHASNCFALLTFLFLLLKGRDKTAIRVLLAWAIIVSYSRIYLGVHYGKIFSFLYFRIATL